MLRCSHIDGLPLLVEHELLKETNLKPPRVSLARETRISGHLSGQRGLKASDRKVGRSQGQNWPQHCRTTSGCVRTNESEAAGAVFLTKTLHQKCPLPASHGTSSGSGFPPRSCYLVAARLAMVTKWSTLTRVGTRKAGVRGLRGRVAFISGTSWVLHEQFKICCCTTCPSAKNKPTSKTSAV